LPPSTTPAAPPCAREEGGSGQLNGGSRLPRDSRFWLKTNRSSEKQKLRIAEGTKEWDPLCRADLQARHLYLSNTGVADRGPESRGRRRGFGRRFAGNKSEKLKTMVRTSGQTQFGGTLAADLLLTSARTGGDVGWGKGNFESGKTRRTWQSEEHSKRKNRLRCGKGLSGTIAMMPCDRSQTIP